MLILKYQDKPQFKQVSIMSSQDFSYGALMLDIEGKSLTKFEEELIARDPVGGLILFTRNYECPTQLRELVASIRAIKPEILIAVDQEGGRVQRFEKDFVSLPSLGSIGKIYKNQPELAESLAKICAWVMAAELISYDIDLSFAPVLDLQNIRSEVIGDRSFSSDPATVIALAKAYISGLSEAGMSACGKHYPGHGTVRADSHLELPVDDRPWEEIEVSDYYVFAQLTKILGGIMPAHVLYTSVDDSSAGFSKVWIRDKLRDELHFKGIVFSDDLSMAAARAVPSPIDRAKSALAAGCDMILLCNDQQSAIEVANWLDSESIPKNGIVHTMRASSSHKIHNIFEQDLWKSRVQTIRSYFRK